MFGIDMLLKAMGLGEQQIAELKDFLDPVKLKATAAQLYQRFEEMERRNIEIHGAVMDMRAKDKDFIAPHIEREMMAHTMRMLEQPDLYERKNDDGPCNDNSRTDHVNGSAPS